MGEWMSGWVDGCRRDQTGVGQKIKPGTGEFSTPGSGDYARVTKQLQPVKISNLGPVKFQHPGPTNIFMFSLLSSRNRNIHSTNLEIFARARSR